MEKIKLVVSKVGSAIRSNTVSHSCASRGVVPSPSAAAISNPDVISLTVIDFPLMFL